MAIQIKTAAFVEKFGREPFVSEGGTFHFATEDGAWVYSATYNTYLAAKQEAQKAFRNRFNASYGVLVLCPREYK